MDFYRIAMLEPKKELDPFEISADFIVGRSKDLMVRGRAFYAIWDEERGLWSRDEYDVQRLVDAELKAEYERLRDKGVSVKPKYLSSFSNKTWAQFKTFVQNVSDNSVDLDTEITFADTPVVKGDYRSKRLPYALASGDYSAWDELVGTLYSVTEREKIEWVIGAIVAGDAKNLQRFLVFYGPPGSGKSTILNIVQKMFAGYTTTFDAKALGSTQASFATEVFKDNPLVAIQHDGDLSKIEDNARLNSIISHEEMPMNEKFKAAYTSRVNAFFLMGTNQPVKISDAKSGMLRRLLDVHPTGVSIPKRHYDVLLSNIDFELGAIAAHCLDVYRQLGKNHYGKYRPLEMMLQTDVFFNFVEANYDVFKFQNWTTLTQAYDLYKLYCDDAGIERRMAKHKFREELRNYFDEFHLRGRVDGKDVSNYFSGFTAAQFKVPSPEPDSFSLVIDETESLLDDILKDAPAQLASSAGTPRSAWASVRTTLSDVDTHDLHYVQLPENHIVLDFDLKDEDGNKSLERNLEAASHLPATYAELSQGGNGVHLHYIWDGPEPVGELASTYSEGIEVKTLLGDASLRRRLTKCNHIPIATLKGGLPIKETRVLSEKTMQSEKGLRDLINRNLRKEIHPNTKPSVSFILKILEDAKASGMTYDVTDMRSRITAFANNSENQAMECLKMVMKMPWKNGDQMTETQPEEPGVPAEPVKPKDDRAVFFDVEVFPNLVVVCWKFRGEKTVAKLINPGAKDIEPLLKYKLVGFNNRRYDNHILYALYMGYTIEAVYGLSKKIIANERSGMFGEAYSISYADIYDFSSKKQSLKLFEIELGLLHDELGLPWDEPVAESLWTRVAEYCANDVNATESVFEARKADFTAREILAALSGLQVNEPTAKHTAKIIFGSDRRPQDKFNYTDLSKDFPGYVFDKGKSTYRGEDVGEGGYVYAEQGMYEHVVLLDIASMHPASLIALDYFGPYTGQFQALRDARIAIKTGDYESARGMLNGRLAPYLTDESTAKDLAYALKIVINIVYGLTAAKFENVFRSPKNVDNIVAKRGALFMIDLKLALQERGCKVVHIKTDSIKLVAPSKDDIQFVTEYGEKWGYEFVQEAVYDKFCLVNDAVYIARDVVEWHATGAQFAHPYVFKQLFSGEEHTFKDLCETKSVQKGAMYLDFEDQEDPIQERMHFVGKTGRFVPVEPGAGGGILYRCSEGKSHAVAGTKGHRWMEAYVAEGVGKDLDLDYSYYEKLVAKAIETIEKFGNYQEFVEV